MTRCLTFKVRASIIRRELRRAVTAIALTLACGAAAVACRYTVRDIGFVDLRGPEYVVVVRGAQARSLIAPLQERLKDSNVRCVLESDVRATESAESRLAQATGSLVLLDAEGRALTLLDDTESLEIEDAKQAIDEALFTPTIDRIAEASCDSFAQMVLISGSNPESNQVAADIMREAEQALRRIEPLLPRPLQYPVKSITVASAQRAEERAFVWSLGLNPDEFAEPVLVVVYGRGRLAGPPMVGDQIELRETLAQLALVGESCECETDRAWLQEKVIPIDWPKDLRANSADLLGFDPESPLVQAEVTRIVSRGPSSDERSGRGQNSGSDDIERLLLGYEETQLQPLDSDIGGGAEAGPVNAAGTNSGTTSGVKATVETGEGWDFDESHDGDQLASNADPSPNDSAQVAADPQAEVPIAPSESMTLDTNASNSDLTHGVAGDETASGEPSRSGMKGSSVANAKGAPGDEPPAEMSGSFATVLLALVALGAVALVVVAWIVLGGRGR